MSVDVFGRNLKQVEDHGSRVIIPAIGFKLTSEGDFDIDNRRLCQIAAPLDSADAVNFETLNFHIGGLLDSLALKWEKHDISIDQLVKQQRNSSDSFTKEREALDARINELKEQQQLEPTDSVAKQLEEKLVNTINKKIDLIEKSFDTMLDLFKSELSGLLEARAIAFLHEHVGRQSWT
uniref:Uncharacterized protein n=1 Tax=Trichogramma kaykai TaxID=54128 RepID=A0ABD2XHD5_9HYME